MKYSILLLLICSLSFCYDPSQPDKIKHRYGMLLGTTAMYTAMRLSGYSIGTSVTASVLTGLAVGYAKESFSDSFYDRDDITANYEGIGMFFIVPLIDVTF